MSAPRWKTIFERSLQNTDKKSASSYSFASIDEAQTRVRTIIHRGFFIPNGPGQPIFASTTDIRSHKAAEILSNNNVEAVWYLRDVEEQFRVSGTAYIVPALQHPLYARFKEQFDILTFPGYDWDTERRNRFNDKSPFMRASWARPPPGSPLPNREQAESWPESLPALGESKSPEEESQTQFAFSNFALLYLDPYRIDWAELGVQPNRRTVFTKKRGTNEWTEVFVVP